MTLQDIPICSGIYRITCTATGKFYIGSAMNIRQRRYNHFRELRRNEHRNQKLQHAWNKYGELTFAFEIVELVLSPFLLEREQYWLDTLQPFEDNGFNIAITAGSSFGLKHSPETRAKLRDVQLGRKHSEEHKGKAAQSRIGTKRSVETRAKMSAAQLGNTKNLGKKYSPARCAQMSEQRKGKKRALEIDAHRRKTLIVISPDGIEHVIHGIKNFCKEHQLNMTHLVNVAKGKHSQHKGWKARFPD